MLPLEISAVFFVTSLLLALSPGPDNTFVLLQSALLGRSAGLKIVAGLCTGLIFHTLAVALGLAALLATLPWAYRALTVAGALYLLYLAWQAWHVPTIEPEASAQALSSRQLYRRGVVMNLSNPKVSLFFLAFLPQFTRPELGALAWQVLALGLLFMLATAVVFGALAWFAARLGSGLRRSPRGLVWLNRISAAVFVILAARLLLLH